MWARAEVEKRSTHPLEFRTQFKPQTQSYQNNAFPRKAAFVILGIYFHHDVWINLLVLFSFF